MNPIWMYILVLHLFLMCFLFCHLLIPSFLSSYTFTIIYFSKSSTSVLNLFTFFLCLSAYLCLCLSLFLSPCLWHSLPLIFFQAKLFWDVSSFYIITVSCIPAAKKNHKVMEYHPYILSCRNLHTRICIIERDIQ